MIHAAYSPKRLPCTDYYKGLILAFDICCCNFLSLSLLSCSYSSILFAFNCSRHNRETMKKKRAKIQISTKQKQQGLKKQGEGGYLRTSCFYSCVTNPKVESLLHATRTGLRSDESKISWQEKRGIQNACSDESECCLTLSRKKHLNHGVMSANSTWIGYQSNF